MRKILLIFGVLALVFIVSCAPAQTTQQTTTAPPQPKEDVKQPVEQPSIIQPKQEISAEVKELLDKSKTRVKNIYYKYRGPETSKTGDNFFEFYVKDTKIKYIPAREIQSLDLPDSYDVIFIDKTAETAISYCEATYCAYKGKKADLNYDEAYIKTVLDWVDGITDAKKVGEEIIDERNTWKVEANNGILWIDTFYGIPLKIESNGKTYRFQQISANSVQDSDVTAS